MIFLLPILSGALLGGGTVLAINKMGEHCEKKCPCEKCRESKTPLPDPNQQEFKIGAKNEPHN
jgi:hypothetical protein